MRTLEDTQYFDVLVGYFRSSGFYQMYEAIEHVDKTRILVGLGIDEESYKVIDEYQNQTVMDFDSHANAKKETFKRSSGKEKVFQLPAFSGQAKHLLQLRCLGSSPPCLPHLRHLPGPPG